jgi:hypothetical protein
MKPFGATHVREHRWTFALAPRRRTMAGRGTVTVRPLIEADERPRASDDQTGAPA